ncbi:MAG: hypothetical protein H7210_04405 [Pyrinomonadaceae bacterium]|nr:hypothetical protein [Phycisphaerales bacterium]
MDDMKGEISYDFKMLEEVPFVEGTFRLPGSDWQVVIFCRRDIEEPKCDKEGAWRSGVTGLYVEFPRKMKLNKAVVEQILSREYGVDEWVEVRGPDSIVLR